MTVTRRILLMTLGVVVFVMVAAACSEGTTSASGDLGSTPAPEVESEDTGSTVTSTDDAIDVTTGATPTPTPLPTPTPEGPRPILVATLMGETNVMRPLDGPAVAGVVAKVAELNEEGGLLGRMIEVRRFDTESRVSRAERLADQLQRDPPDLVIVSCDVEFARPILELADEQGWLTISPCAEDIGYTNGAWGPRNFTLGAPAESRGELAAQYALARYGSTALVLRDVTSPEAQRFCSGFERAFRELGGTVNYRDEFAYETLEPLLDRLTDRAPTASFITMCTHVPGGSRGDGAENIVNQLRLLGFSAPIVSGSSVDETNWFGRVPALNEMTYVSWSSSFGNDPNAAVNALTARVNDDTDTPPAGSTTVLGADSIEAWARAVRAVRTLDHGQVAASLGSFVNEPLLTGRISFAGGSRMDPTRTYRVLRISGNEVQVPELAEIAG